MRDCVQGDLEKGANNKSAGATRKKEDKLRWNRAISDSQHPTGNCLVRPTRDFHWHCYSQPCPFAV